jgi:hypothetical protein
MRLAIPPDTAIRRELFVAGTGDERMENEMKKEVNYKWMVSADREYELICTLCGASVKDTKLHNETHEWYNREVK